ncbi:MAG: hypothetical protein IKF64_04515 [Eubacterium sp.]|nr:hypothetical protein [Eubacterium sp.]
MFKFTARIAELNIEMNCNYGFTRDFCRDYLTDDGAPDFSISVTEENIDREIEISPYNPSRPYAESICAYREVAEKLPYYDRLVFHGAVISYDNCGYIFTAPSGTGKTTHIRLWHKYIGGVDVVNGDKPILHITENKVNAYATPYAGKEGYQNHSLIELKGICLIEQAKENSIERIEVSDCLSRIMSQIYKPYDAVATVKTLELLDKLLRNIPVYLLKCNMEEDAVKCSFEALTQQSYDERKMPDEN